MKVPEEEGDVAATRGAGMVVGRERDLVTFPFPCSFYRQQERDEGPQPLGSV